MALPTKAPPPAPAAPPPLDIHGFAEFDYSSFLINPQGQALATHGAETFVAGLNWTVYHDKGGFVNAVTVGGGLALDFANNFNGYWGSFNTNGGVGPRRDLSAGGALFDSVYFVNGSVTFGQYWTLSDTFYNVYSDDVCGNQGGTCAIIPGVATKTSGFGWLNFNELKLSLNDSFTGWWITFNPYITWYYEFAGFNPGEAPACFNCQMAGSDFFVGITPTVNLKNWGWSQITLKAPTYVTVGASSFWGCSSASAATGGCGAVGAVPGSPGSSGGVGVFTTGLTGIWSLTWIPSNYGAWYLKGGFQWYDVINANLQASNAASICGLGATTATCSSGSTKNIFVGFAGLGVGF